MCHPHSIQLNNPDKYLVGRSHKNHRCQGDTLNEAVVDFPASTREHMHYVDLSRVRNSSALHILNLNENKIRHSVYNEKMQSDSKNYVSVQDDEITCAYYKIGMCLTLKKFTLTSAVRNI